MTLAEAFLGSPSSRLFIAGLAALAAGGLVVALAVVFGRRQARVERRLAGYEMQEFAATPVSQSEAGGPDSRMVQQAVEFTSRVADRAGLLIRTELLLEQADLPLRPAELLFYVPTFAVLAFVLGLLLSTPAVGLLLAGMVVAVPIGYVAQKRQVRLRQFEEQLPDTLQLLAGAMRAGFSFIQAMETVSEESTDPMRRELQRVFTEARLGRPIEEALGEVADRMRSQDLAWAVMAIRIQREVGGNLSELLDTVADTMTKRERLRREIRALTAEGRLSAVVLSLFPPGFALLLFALEPEYMRRLFEESIGIIALVAAGVLSVFGWFWLRKIVSIEV